MRIVHQNEPSLTIDSEATSNQLEDTIDTDDTSLHVMHSRNKKKTIQQQLIETMASVRTEESFPPCVQAWTVETNPVNHVDPVEEITHSTNLR